MSRSEEAPFGASSGSFRQPSRPSGATAEPVEHEGATGEPVGHEGATGEEVEHDASTDEPAEPSSWTADAESRLAELWSSIDAHPPEAFRRLVEQAVEHAPSAVVEYELAGVHDSFGEESLAEPRYRRALSLGLEPDREAVRLAVGGIGASVTRYSRSLTGYAAELPEG